MIQDAVGRLFSAETSTLSLLRLYICAHVYFSRPLLRGVDAIMWSVNIGFGVFAALVHVPISNEPFAELVGKTKATDRESQAGGDTTAAKEDSKTIDSRP